LTRLKSRRINAILEHDLQLIEKAEELQEGAKKIVSMEIGEEGWRAALDGLITKVEALDSLIDARAEALRGLSG